MDSLPIIELRRIEANIIKPIYDEMVRSLGKEQAQEILGRAIIQNAMDHGASYAANENVEPDLTAFAALLPQWTQNDALEIDMIEQSESQLDFNVTRCRYSEMYREMGLGEIGHLLSCNRDGSFCDGYNPDIKLTRTQTKMSGASHCDFRYAYEPKGE
ncbi:MAG: 2-amino-thiazoline-4-carboxylic acid hydrolase [Alphaproteobacteria bacterium]|nr:2-amino-thiazoline-4-carboxylic acid hydrolase [Alphaproteobacteria bacterium]